MLVSGALFTLQLAAAANNAPARAETEALVAHARGARYQQDSSLAAYDVLVRQRMSAGVGVARGLGIGPLGGGRERLLARHESVARLGWHHEFGAWAQPIGVRSVIPFLGRTQPDPNEMDEDVALVLPYVPGRDRLWPMEELRIALPDADDWIEHPLEPGADSLYEFSLGDSLQFRLPDRSVVVLREIRVRPRRPASRLIVGSLWVDAASGSLVRAAYRPSVPMDLWPLMEREIGANDRDKVRRFGPFTGIIREVIIEHGLYERRFWLPRARVVNAEGTARGARLSISITQTFEYQRVRALAPGIVNQGGNMERNVDPRTGRVMRPRWYGVEERTSRCRERGDSSARWSADSLLRDADLSVMYAAGVRFRVLLPCDRMDLITSPALPPSIYADGEELFTETDFAALRRDVEGALSLGSQARWEPQPPTISWGLERGLLRYNRVEGLSAGVRVDRVLGNGYTAYAIARLGIADLQPNGELRMRRSDGQRELQGALFRRLDAANDWGTPLGLGASLNAAVLGRDDGFYYRAIGGELAGVHTQPATSRVLSWRLFAERHTTADVETHASLARLTDGSRFRPNITAREGINWGGAAAVWNSWGLNPDATRLSIGTRGEAAVADSAYARILTEWTMSQGLGARRLATLTAAAGTSAGSVPPQRLWYLGGAHTIRGYRAGDFVGDAFWFGRAELSQGHPMARPSLFVDAGWAGSRQDWARQPRPIAGAGVGLSALDGLVRLDVSRGLGEGRRWRLDFYLEPR
ncbi:MAG: ShlB/FhaC/HecB family hemolysin secretion/activation protein [Gemmatimonadaceae bacterium]